MAFGRRIIELGYAQVMDEKEVNRQFDSFKESVHNENVKEIIEDARNIVLWTKRVRFVKNALKGRA